VTTTPTDLTDVTRAAGVTGVVCPADLTGFVRGLFAAAAGHDEFDDGDSFFHIGGDSLSGLKVARRLGEAVGAHMGIRALFENPTVISLAAYAETLAAQNADRLSGGDVAIATV
jgi:hypothetical protein